MKLFFLSLTLILFTACEYKHLNYTPKITNFSLAVADTERCIYSQLSNWRPDKFAITNVYFELEYSLKRVNNINSRFFYEDVEEVKLLSWIGKLHQWYVVTLVMKNGEKNHMYRTKSIDEAKKATNSIATIVNYYKK